MFILEPGGTCSSVHIGTWGARVVVFILEPGGTCSSVHIGTRGHV